MNGPLVRNGSLTTLTSVIISSRFLFTKHGGSSTSKLRIPFRFSKNCDDDEKTEKGSWWGPGSALSVAVNDTPKSTVCPGDAVWKLDVSCVVWMLGSKNCRKNWY